MFPRIRIYVSLVFSVLILSLTSLPSAAAVSTPVTEIVFNETISELMLSGESHRFSNGDSYVGFWLHNKPHGKGTYQRLNGDVYEGEFRNGYMHGVGTYKFSNGDRYEGEWKKGVTEGYGTLNYHNGNRYIGQWKQGVRWGNGKLYYRSGSVFEGGWVNDQKQGKGLMTYRNGERYIGDYKYNKPHGHGIKTDNNGEVYRGTFSKGVKHGVGECNYDGGAIRICLFNKGREIRDPQKIELAKAYYKKHQPKYEYDGGIAYHVQDEFTKARYYITTKQVWWEKTVALLETQLRIRAEDNNQFIYLIVNRYTGPGVYHLRKGDVLASTRDGEAVELPEDIVAHVEVKFDEKGEIHGVFNIPKLASGDSQKEYVIYDGRFEARAEPPQEIEDQTGFLVKNQREI